MSNKNRKKLTLKKDSLRELSHDALEEANGGWTGMLYTRPLARCYLLPVDI